jgi:hypothetical protein
VCIVRVLISTSIPDLCTSRMTSFIVEGLCLVFP